MIVRVITNGTAVRTSIVGLAVFVSAACGTFQKRQASTGSSGPSSGDVTGAACADAQLVTAALASLDTNCYSCHGAGGQTKGGPKDVTDLAALVASGSVISKDPTDSPLCQSIVSGSMPPKSSPQPSAADIAALNAWIVGGAPVLQGAQLAAAQASCKAASGNPGGSQGGTPGPAGPAPAPSPGGAGTGGAGAGLALTAADVLSKYCGACHDGGKVSGGLGTITNLPSLVTAGVVTPGDPATSKLYEAITGGKMPPAGKPAPSAAEAQAVANWITNLTAGAGGGGGGGGGGTPTNLTPTDVFTLVAQDLQQIASTSSSPAPFTRYISFAHLASGGVAPADIKDFVNGASRLVNSMSQNRRITPAVPIGPGSSILRIDIRDYNWSQQNWEDILALYPYFKLQRSESLSQQFRQLAQTDLPVVNGDWFAFTAPQPPLYLELLQLGNNEAALEQQLGFNIVTDLQQTVNDTASQNTLVMRAGFSQSKVAINNRVIERHEIANGAYWRSYDFADPGANANAAQQAAKNVFTSPLGSAREINTQQIFGNNISFQEDAGEIIFNLPNGLQGYYLVDANTNLLDAAALNVAKDASRKQGAVLLAYSCMSCHAPGILPKNDEVSAASVNGGFTADELTVIKRLYAPQAQLNAAYTGDTSIYTTALGRASIDPTSTSSMVRSGNIYEQDITLADAAMVVGISPTEFEGLLNNSSQSLKQALAGLLANGTVTREVFEQNFSTLVTDFFGNIPAP